MKTISKDTWENGREIQISGGRPKNRTGRPGHNVCVGQRKGG